MLLKSVLVVIGFIFVIPGSGCARKVAVFPAIAPKPIVSEPPQIKLRVDSETTLTWAKTEPTFLVVDRSCKTLRVYQHGRLTHTYPAVFGRKPGRKLYQGDRRTPTGLYMITDKDPHARWSRFIHLDYPNDEDLRRYQAGVESGLVPREGKSYPGAGGAVGIHGSDRESFNRVGLNWTLGCISLLNSDVEELYSLVSTGTMVYIKD